MAQILHILEHSESASSLVTLGFLYYHGIAVKKDRKQAEEHFLKATALKDPRACQLLNHFKKQLGLFNYKQFEMGHLMTGVKAGYPNALFDLVKKFSDQSNSELQ